MNSIMSYKLYIIHIMSLTHEDKLMFEELPQS